MHPPLEFFFLGATIKVYAGISSAATIKVYTYNLRKKGGSGPSIPIILEKKGGSGPPGPPPGSAYDMYIIYMLSTYRIMSNELSGISISFFLSIKSVVLYRSGVVKLLILNDCQYKSATFSEALSQSDIICILLGIVHSLGGLWILCIMQNRRGLNLERLLIYFLTCEYCTKLLFPVNFNLKRGLQQKYSCNLFFLHICCVEFAMSSNLQCLLIYECVVGTRLQIIS